MPKPSAQQIAIASSRHPRDPQDDLVVLLTALGRLWTAGADVDWKQFYQGQRRRRVQLPTYAFEREKYWVEPTPDTGGQRRVTGKNPQVSEWFYVPAWRSSLPPQAFSPKEYRRTWVELAGVRQRRRLGIAAARSAEVARSRRRSRHARGRVQRQPRRRVHDRSRNRRPTTRTCCRISTPAASRLVASSTGGRFGHWTASSSRASRFRHRRARASTACLLLSRRSVREGGPGRCSSRCSRSRLRKC